MPGQHLYVIQSRTTGAIKVGRSDDPEKRLRQLQTGCPNTLKLILVAENLGIQEKRVHHELRRYKTRHDNGGEWFSEEGIGSIPVDIWELAKPWFLEDPDWWKRR